MALILLATICPTINWVNTRKWIGCHAPLITSKCLLTCKCDIALEWYVYQIRIVHIEYAIALFCSVNNMWPSQWKPVLFAQAWKLLGNLNIILNCKCCSKKKYRQCNKARNQWREFQINCTCVYAILIKKSLECVWFCRSLYCRKFLKSSNFN